MVDPDPAVAAQGLGALVPVPLRHRSLERAELQPLGLLDIMDLVELDQQPVPREPLCLGQPFPSSTELPWWLMRGVDVVHAHIGHDRTPRHRTAPARTGRPTLPTGLSGRIVISTIGLCGSTEADLGRGDATRGTSGPFGSKALGINTLQEFAIGSPGSPKTSRVARPVAQPTRMGRVGRRARPRLSEASGPPRRGRGEGAQEAHADDLYNARPQWLADAHRGTRCGRRGSLRLAVGHHGRRGLGGTTRAERTRASSGLIGRTTRQTVRGRLEWSESLNFKPSHEASFEWRGETASKARLTSSTAAPSRRASGANPFTYNTNLPVTVRRSAAPACADKEL